MAAGRGHERVLRRRGQAAFRGPKDSFFESVDPAGRRLTGRSLTRPVVLAMIKRCARRRDFRPRPAAQSRATGMASAAASAACTIQRSYMRGKKVEGFRGSECEPPAKGEEDAEGVMAKRAATTGEIVLGWIAIVCFGVNN